MKTLLSEAFRRNRLLTLITIVHLALFVLFSIASLLDPAQILGISRWVKPMKFAISIAIFAGTMAWLLFYLQQSARAVRVISRIIAFTMSGEMILITMQSLRGVRSHFNIDSPFDGIVFAVMGLLILLNTFGAIYATWLFFRRPTGVSGAYLAGIQFGMIIFVIASFEGGFVSGRGSHSVGVHDGGPGLPIVNWSTGGGDLRVAHFFGLHALQALPLLGWMLDRRRVAGARRWIHAAAAVWILITTLLLVQALAGNPLLAMR